jgi:hypothetical protein
MGTSSRFSGDFELKNLKIGKLNDPSTAIMDIKGLNLVEQCQVVETIESPVIRATLTMRDTVGFHNLIYGGEVLTFEIANAGKGKQETYKIQLMLTKIGDKIRRERTYFYNLEFASPDAFVNEFQRVNRVYEKKKISEVVSSILSDDLQTEASTDIEATGTPVNMLCPNWRPFDAIAWCCRHAAKSEDSGIGYMFFANARDGYVFKSVDTLLSQSISDEKNKSFVYQPKNVSGTTGEDDRNTIDTVKYPSITKMLNQMRIGSFSGEALGIDLCDLRKTTQSTFKMTEYFDQMEHAERYPFVGLTGSDLENKATRQFVIGLPTHLYTDTNQMNGGVELGGLLDKHLYATLRYQSMKHVMCSIVIPGNTNVFAGDTVKITLPTMDPKGKTMPVDDPIYTGKYLVAAVVHKWTPKELKTELTLCRDSIYKDPSKVS